MKDGYLNGLLYAGLFLIGLTIYMSLIYPIFQYLGWTR